MSYSIAGIEVHKKVLVVVVAEVTEQGEWSYERGKFGATSSELQRLADWFQHGRKWRWSLPRHIGDRCGAPWSNLGRR
jgi:hypothetical protein